MLISFTLFRHVNICCCVDEKFSQHLTTDTANLKQKHSVSELPGPSVKMYLSIMCLQNQSLGFSFFPFQMLGCIFSSQDLMEFAQTDGQKDMAAGRKNRLLAQKRNLCKTSCFQRIWMYSNQAKWKERA